MLDKDIYAFLNDLKENNDRDWFNLNKPRYLAAKDSLESFINQLIPGIRKFDDSIGLIEARDCTFRIYRDIRFSPDKRPYKINMGGYIAKGGRKTMNPGYYIHLEPGKSFLAGGIYMPPSDILKKVRDEIYFNIDEFKQIVNNNNFKKWYNGFEMNEKLKNPPKGYDKEWPDIDWLKYKSFAVAHYVKDEDVISDGFYDYAIKAYKELYKLNKFLMRAL